MKKLLFAILLLFICVSKTTAQKDSIDPIKLEEFLNPSVKGWFYVTTDSDKNAFYINKKPVETSDQLVKVWIKSFLTKATIKKRAYKNVKVMVLYLFDCGSSRDKMETISYFDSKGAVIAKQDIDEPVWKNVVPETTEAKILNKACELFIAK